MVNVQPDSAVTIGRNTQKVGFLPVWSRPLIGVKTAGAAPGVTWLPRAETQWFECCAYRRRRRDAAFRDIFKTIGPHGYIRRMNHVDL